MATMNMPYARPGPDQHPEPPDAQDTGIVGPTDCGNLRPVRVMIAGGGTGGHLFPGVALAETVKARGGEVRFVGTERGIEARVLPEEGWDLDLIEVSGIKGRGLRGLAQGLLRLPRAWVQSRRLLRAFAPDVVVGVGGYASGPVVATAAGMGIPTAILEQNSIPGMTNRILGRLVREVFATFPDEHRRFPPRKLVITGNPIRRALLERLVADADARTRQGPPRLFVFGGSQGAKALNESMMAALPELRERLPALEVWHQTGRAMESEVVERYATLGLTEGEPPAVRAGAFIKDMSEPYRWCDLVLCRAGATSLAELAAVGCPALLVPFPHATDNHQEHNARALVEAGAAEILLERDLTPKALVERVSALLADRQRLAAMRAAMIAAARPDAADAIYERLEKLVHGR